MELKLPENFEYKQEGEVLKNVTLVLTNVNSGLETKVNVTDLFPKTTVEDGLYNLLIEGEAVYQTQNIDSSNVEKTIKVRGAKENINITGGEFSFDVALFFFNENSGFVLSEILFTGTKTPEGKQYNDDKYIEIHNNSSEVLYADGLCVAETAFNTALYLNSLEPNIISTHTAVKAVYKIPGTGKDYPVQPGETILLCDKAIDHTAINANSFDLSGANFEWFDGEDLDTDAPEVENMIKMVSGFKSAWPLHNRGFTSYILFKLDGVTPEQFTTDYAYHYDYLFIFNDKTYEMDGDCWKVPNENIIDAVECSTPSDFEWKVLDPSLDLTWTHSGDADDARYGKSVSRKTDRVENGRIILLDTNDSGMDFTPTSEPTPGKVE